MTPNQIEGIGRAVAALLREAHEGSCEPTASAALVREWCGLPRGSWCVEVCAVTPEGEEATLTAIVDEGGNVERLDTHSPEPDTYEDPLARPGVRIDADGQPLYSSKWL